MRQKSGNTSTGATQRDVAVSGNGTNSNPTPTTVGLIAYYPFNNNVYDESSSGFNGTLMGTVNGGPTFVSDINGNQNCALSFDGVDDYVSVPNFTWTNTTAFTICVFVNVVDLLQERGVLDISTNNPGIEISNISHVYGWPYIDYFPASGGSASYSLMSQSIQLNNFVHLAVTMNNGSIKGYVNGIKYNEWSTAASQFINGILKIGVSYYGWMKGILDEIRIYDRVLSDFEIQTIYNYGSIAPKNYYANIKLFLQGGYSSGVMNTSLNTRGLIPLNQPFNTTPWSYTGTENVASVPNNIVDWVLLELRSGTGSATIVERRAAFLKSDGTVVDMDGTSPVKFNSISDGNYYIVVYHRNHLAIMSSAPQSFTSGNVTNYNFTTSQSQAFTTGAASMADLGGGFFGMIAGNANADGFITASDKNIYWVPQNGLDGYRSGDFNLDSYVTSGDKNLLWIPNNGKSTQVP
jgi:hypothetical protein